LSLITGTRLGPYEILGLIGAGGMGEVYKARDTRLDRTVAIKILPPQIADPEHCARFEREARTIAGLSHPHICTLYDVGSAAGVEFLVMEHLEGETLAARLVRNGTGNPLSLHETLHIATQFADALAAAHHAGVIHRDLKPANIMLARTGAAWQSAPELKVLDFGLAKLRAEPEGAAAQTTTAVAPLTGQNAILGTLPYMAPEQLDRRQADARTDLFAFGAIVYEMASGRRAFSGNSQASLIAAILDRDPEPLSSIQLVVPPGLDRLVRKCLAKNPEARWQSAIDVADELRWIAAGSGAGSAALPVRTHGHLSRWVAIAGGLLLAVAGTGIWKWRGVVRHGPPQVQHRQVTFAGDVVGAAISPDGRSVVYGVGEQGTEIRVLVRDLAGGQTQPIWTGRYLWTVAWVSDGSHVMVSGWQRDVSGIQQYEGIWIVPRLGGSTRRVLDWAPLFASSPDGKTLAGTIQPTMGFTVISPESPAGREVKMTGFRWSMALDWHPRTNRVILLTLDDDQIWTIWSVTPDGQEQMRLHAGKDPIRAICSSPVSDVVYALRERGGTSELVRIRMRSGADSTSVLLTGLPVTNYSEIGRCTLSADGRRLIYTRAAKHANLWRLDLARTTEATMLTQGTLQFAFPKVSPDGQWIAATRGPESDPELVKIPIGGGEPVALGEGTGPAWSADGQRLAFVSRRSGSKRMWVTRADSVWPEEVKDSAVGNEFPIWLPDGRLAWPTPDARNYRIRDLRTGRDEHLLKDDSIGWVFHPRFSPRGDQVVVWWNRRIKQPYDRGVWLLSWPGREERRLTSEDLTPIGWSADGEWIYATAFAGRAVFRVSGRTGKTERIGQFPVGTLENNLCDLTPDRSAIICSLTEQQSDAWLMENFDPEVREEVGGRVP
jgi:Tol biopolymer transport system component